MLKCFQESSIRYYLCSTELQKAQNRMICTFRNSVLFGLKKIMLSGTPETDIQKDLRFQELLKPFFNLF